MGYLEPAAYQRTVKVLLAGGSDPVIKKDPGAGCVDARSVEQGDRKVGTRAGGLPPCPVKEVDMSLLIRGGTVVNADRASAPTCCAKAATSAPWAPTLQAPAGAQVVDAGGPFVMPGGIDPHTHMQLPFMGTVTMDDFYTGTARGAGRRHHHASSTSSSPTRSSR